MHYNFLKFWVVSLTCQETLVEVFVSFYNHPNRLRYLTQSSINVECWREIAQGGLHPVGWCSTHSIPLTVPPDLSAQLQEEDAKQEAIEAVEEAQKVGVSVPEEALDIDGYTAIDRIKCGMKVEVSVKNWFFCLCSCPVIFLYFCFPI